MNLVKKLLSRAERYFSALALGLTLALMLAVTVGTWKLTSDSTESEARKRFEFRVTQISEAIHSRMVDYEQVMRGAVGLFAASVSVERDEWRAYVESLRLDQNYPGIQGLGFAKHVPVGTREAHIRRVRVDGFPLYTIHPEGERPEYTPIVYLEPFRDRNLRAFGYDMFSEPVRRAAMQRARDGGNTTISGRVVLVQETGADTQAGILMYLPVYRNGMETTTIEQRRMALDGYVYGAFRMDDLMRAVVGNVLDVRIEIFDGATAGVENLLFDSAKARGTGTDRAQAAFNATEHIIVHDHPWLLRLTSLPAFEAGTSRDRPRAVLVGGITASIMLTVIVWLLVTLRRRAIALANRMTADLRVSRERLGLALEGSNLALFEWNLTTGLVELSDRWNVVLGGGAEPTVTTIEALRKMVHPDDMPQLQQRLRPVIEGSARSYRVEHRVRGHDGEWRWILSRAKVAERDATGRAVRVAGTNADISERKRAERALVESRERLELALEASDLAFFDWDTKTGRVDLSARWSTILGGKAEPVVTTVQELELLAHPEDRPGIRQKLSDLLRGTSLSYENELRVRTHAGEWKWIQSRAKVVERDAHSQAVRVTGTSADISGRKEIERLKNEFIATVSHELRTPLTGIIGALALLREESRDALSPDAAGFLDMAERNSERLAALINDILDIEKIESGRMEFHMGQVRLRPLLESAIELNQMYAKRHGVIFRLEEPVAEVGIVTDRDRLLQVLTNLLSNAAKFSPPGESVSVRAAPRDGWLRISVSDQGQGVPEAFRDRIFGKFEQADAISSKLKSGTGLGLAISKAIVEKMGGRIGFDSEPGKGATFYFDLPIEGAPYNQQRRDV